MKVRFILSYLFNFLYMNGWITTCKLRVNVCNTVCSEEVEYTKMSIKVVCYKF